MTRLALLQALPALLAIIPAVSSTPLTLADLYTRKNSPSDEGLWPKSLAPLSHNESWANFAKSTVRWSSYEAPTFNEVFLPTTEKELSKGLQYMSSNNFTWLAKNGGHGYTSTLHSVQNAVQINMQNFNTVKMQKDGTVVVGSGALFHNLIDVVGAAGRELNVGTCGCVGATGAMLGGGLGRLQGLHGLTSDALRKARVVLWNGTVVTASDSVNQDLFWAIRGSGQNYGIVTESTYETWPATNGGQVYNADLVFKKDAVKHIIDTINKLSTPALDSKLDILTYFAFGPTSELEVIVDLVYAGPKAQGQKYTKMFNHSSLSAVEKEYPWADLPTRSVLGLVTQACAEGPRYNLYSMIAKRLDTPTYVEFANKFEKFLQDNPLANGSALQIESYPVQGVQALPDSYSAFPHRKTFNNQVESIGTYTDDSVAASVNDFFLGWRNKFAKPAISGYPDLYIYQNYAHGDEPLTAIYGKEQWRHERLTRVKNAYDPHGFFDGYNPVPRDMAAWSGKV